jgi:hypothetical protein
LGRFDRAVLNLIRAFEEDTPISREEVLADDGRERSVHWINCGADFPTEVNRLTDRRDPTVFGLRLSYRPRRAPGERRQYLLKLPAIDRKAPARHRSTPSKAGRGNPTRSGRKPTLRRTPCSDQSRGTCGSSSWTPPAI